MSDPNMSTLFTISCGKRCIVKSSPLGQTLECLKEELEDTEFDQEFDLHVWREN